VYVTCAILAHLEMNIISYLIVKLLLIEENTLQESILLMSIKSSFSMLMISTHRSILLKLAVFCKKKKIISIFK
jgi:hypothetical protein